jgi:WD40 repeat protein
MSEQGEPRLDDLELDAVRRIEMVCRRFEAEWRAGKQPAIDVYLGEVSPNHRPALRLELSCLERELAQHDRVGAAAMITDALTVVRGQPTTLRIDGTISSSGHEEASLFPRDEVTLELGPQPAGRLDPTSPNPHVRYFGDYEIVREIARGGMGVVFQATQINLNRKVALKMILAGQLADDDAVRRFYIEAEAAASLDHPGIVPIYEVGKHDGQHYFSMGFVDGQSLSQRLVEGPFPFREAARLVRRVSEAIEYAHQHGVIHRDLKPANILLDQNGNPRVTDFGLAKKVESDSGLTGSGQIMGSPSYMPPEQAGGKSDVGPAADIYALGATLYTLIVGRPPFQAASPMDTIIQAINEEPVSPRRLNPSIPFDLDTICLKCLQKEPSRRYGSASDLADDLGRYLAGDPIVARPVSALERVAKWVRRRPAIATLSATLVLTALLGLAGVFWQWRKTEANYREARAQRDVADAKTREVIQKSEVIERQNYINLVNLAHRETLANDIVRANQLLDRCPPARRAWEWSYVKALIHQEVGSFALGGTAPNISLAISRDGRWYAVAIRDRIKLFDVKKSQFTRDWKAHDGTILSIAFSADGLRLASGGSDTSVSLWDPTSGERIAQMTGHRSGVYALAFDPKGERILSGSGAYPGDRQRPAELKLWDLSRRQPVRDLEVGGGAVWCAAFDPTGGSVASGNADGIVRVTDLTGADIRKARHLTGHVGPVYGVGFSPDGKSLASGGHDGTIRLWDVASSQTTHQLRGHAGFTQSVEFAPGGQWLVSAGSDSSVRLWELATSREWATLRGHTAPVRQAFFHTDGSALASVSEDATLKVWSAARGGNPRNLLMRNGLPNRAVFSPDGRLIATGGWGVVKLWDAATGRELKTMSSPLNSREVTALAFGPAGMLATAGTLGVILLWDAERGEIIHTFPRLPGQVRCIEFSPDAEQMAAACDDGTTTVWNVRSRDVAIKLLGHTAEVCSLSFDPSGQRIATLGRDSTVRVWDRKSGRETLKISDQFKSSFPYGDSVLYSSDGSMILAVTDDGSISVRDAATGDRIRSLGGHSKPVNGMAIISGQPRLATASDDGSIKIWDLEFGDEVFSLRDHGIGVTTVRCSPDGRRLASAGYDRTVKIRDAVLK